MTALPELARQSKREAQFSSDRQHTYHVFYLSRSGQRKVKEEEQWKRTKALGRGSFGAVYLEECVRGQKEGKLRAVKEIRKPEDTNYYRELEAVALFSYERYRHCFVESFGWYENDDSIFISVEYLPFGDLHQHLGSPLRENEGQHIVNQILEGLDFMHDNDFAHRDLKPANILVVQKGPEWWVKIADFGISKRATEGLTALRTLTGTPAFAAPEVLGYGPVSASSRDTYTNAVDLWSTGVITYLILTGETYFKDPGRLFQYVGGVIGFPIDVLQASSISESGCNFTKSLMVPEPNKRPTVKESLKHPWLANVQQNLISGTPRTPYLGEIQPSTLSSPDREPSAR